MQVTSLKALAVAALLPLGAAGCASQLTYGTGVPVGLQTVQDISNLVSLGENKPDITYQPRGAVVVPPTTNLPPPRDTQTASTADWPNDPDEYLKRVAAENANRPVKDNAKDPSANAGLAAYLPKSSGYDDPGSNAGGGLTPKEAAEIQKGAAALKSAHAQEAGSTDANGAPVRRYLIEPPTDYRVDEASVPETKPPETKYGFQALWPFNTFGQQASK